LPFGKSDKSGLREYKLLVFKVNKKIFEWLTLAVNTTYRKMYPELAIELREKYQAVQQATT
jgi:hypothetical protein